MKTLLWLAAGYLGYEYFLAPALAAASPAPAAAAAPAAIPAPSVNPQTSQAMILALAAKNGVTQTTVDGWNWYYQQVRGVAPASPDQWGFKPETLGEILTFPEYWAIATQHGLSGGYRRTL